MVKISSMVMKRHASRFNMAGQKLPDTLFAVDEQISQGLADRLRRYALRALTEGGFDVAQWDCEISTMDGDLPPPERYYVVMFENERGGKLGVEGIGTHHGHPTIDHGFCIEGAR